jgi:hypothetical protein
VVVISLDTEKLLPFLKNCRLACSATPQSASNQNECSFKVVEYNRTNSRNTFISINDDFADFLVISNSYFLPLSFKITRNRIIRLVAILHDVLEATNPFVMIHELEANNSVVVGDLSWVNEVLLQFTFCHEVVAHSSFKKLSFIGVPF